MDEKLKAKIAKDIAYVRKTGAVNMFDRLGVIEVLEFVGGKQSTADYLRDNKNEYAELLVESGNY